MFGGLFDIKNHIHPRDSLITDEGVKKPTNETNPGSNQNDPVVTDVISHLVESIQPPSCHSILYLSSFFTQSKLLYFICDDQCLVLISKRCSTMPGIFHYSVDCHAYSTPLAANFMKVILWKLNSLYSLEPLPS